MALCQHCQQKPVKHWRRSFCSRSCVMAAKRAKETPEQRRALALKARLAQGKSLEDRMVARVQVLGENEAQRIRLAWRMGRAAKRSADYRRRGKPSDAQTETAA
jgi:hypothetical protein